MSLTEGSVITILTLAVGWIFKMVFGAIKTTAEDAKTDMQKLDEKSVLGDEKNNEKIEANDTRTNSKIIDAEARVNDRIAEVRQEHAEMTQLYRNNDHKIFDALKVQAVELARAETKIVSIESKIDKLEAKLDLILSSLD